MTRLAKILSAAGLASVYLMQTPCTFEKIGGGFSVLPDVFSSLSIGSLLGGLGLGT